MLVRRADENRIRIIFSFSLFADSDRRVLAGEKTNAYIKKKKRKRGKIRRIERVSMLQRRGYRLSVRAWTRTHTHTYRNGFIARPSFCFLSEKGTRDATSS